MKKASDYFKGMKKGETLIAPNNPAVLAYLKAAREGKGLAEKVLIIERNQIRSLYQGDKTVSPKKYRFFLDTKKPSIIMHVYNYFAFAEDLLYPA
jgi:hypothetical protein